MQDWILATAQVGFVPAMAVSVRSAAKPALVTSIANTGLVAVIATGQASLGLWIAAATSTLVGTTWAVLAVQTLASNRHRRRWFGRL